MDSAPLWLIATTLFAVLFAARELGFLLRWRKRASAARTSNDDEGHVLSVSLGLLGLLIGFTFALALSRYDLKRELVVREANAIGSTFDYTALLDEPDRTAVQAQLRAYVDARLRYSEQRPNVDRAYQETRMLQAAMLERVAHAVHPIRQTSLATALIGSLSNMSAAAAERQAAIEARVPARVFEVLVLYAVIVQGILGFVLGDPTNRQRPLGFVLSGLLTIALVLIVDLDRPRGGTIRVSLQPMLDLQASLQSASEEGLR